MHVVPSLAEQDSKALQILLPNIPVWIKYPDHDRIDWLNKFIETLWPYLDKAICKTVKTIVQPIIAEQIPKYNSVQFEVLCLGSLPPTFTGMRVYTTEEEELIMEPSLKWAGNPNVLVAVKAFGLRATVQIVDKLKWYVQDGDTIVDFCCGSNDFSCLMRERLHKMGKICSFKNYDLFTPKNDFNFEQKDWMTVTLEELPAGSNLIMGLNPPFGVNGYLANKFIDKALTFKPKLLILIVHIQTERSIVTKNEMQ